jgi:intracellular multiplication protein IcmC
MKIFNTNSKLINDHCLILIFFLLLPLTTAYADTGSTVNWPAMLAALKNNIRPVLYLIKAIGYVVGFWMIVSAIMELKKFGQTQSATTTDSGLGGPLLRMALGIALIYYPTTIPMAVATLSGSGSIVQYAPASPDAFTPAKEGALLLIQAIGYVSFIRGFVTLSNSTKPGAQQGTVGKGVVYIVGGILAINIVATIQMIGSTLGIALLQ